MSAKTDRSFEGAALAPRVSKETTRSRIRELAERLKAGQAAYRGGLAAERQSAEAQRVALKAQMRASYFAGLGRRIDLSALMAKACADGKPKWAVADPTQPLSDTNGAYDRFGNALVARHSHASYWVYSDIHVDHKKFANVRAAGLPALPPRVRQLATDQRIRKHARWVGVVYQPESWTEINPDPALVVEWKERPGEYYALAVWGGDRPEIMEFVD